MRKNFLTLTLLLFFGVCLFAQPRAASEPRMLVQTSDEPLQRPVWSADGNTLFLNNGYQISSDGTNYRRSTTPAATLRRQAAAVNPLLQQMIDEPVRVVSQVAGLSSLAGHMVFNPVLSPTGDRIVFEADMGKGLFVMNADGTGLRSLGTGISNATWTADGRYLVVMRTEDDGRVITKGDLMSVDVATGARNLFFASDRFITFNPVISPDGRRLVFEDYATRVIYIMDIQQ